MRASFTFSATAWKSLLSLLQLPANCDLSTGKDRFKLLVGFLLACCVGCEASNEGHAELAVKGTAFHDFGACQQGDVLQHTFVLVNRASAPIEVVNLRTSCGCVVASIADKRAQSAIPSGGEFELPIQFTVNQTNDNASALIDVYYRSAGKREHSNAKKPDYAGRLSLRVAAETTPDYRISPSRVDFGAIDIFHMKKKASRTIRVAPEALHEIVLKQLRTSSDLVTTRILPGGGGPNGYEIELSLNTSKLSRSQTIDETLILETNSERSRKALVPIRAEYRAPLSVTPDSIVVGSEEIGEARKQICIATCRKSRILSAKSASELVQVEVDSQVDSRQHNVQLRIPFVTQPIDTVVLLEVELLEDKGYVYTIEVPVYRFYRV
jgi:hypothetical protein